jgi:hypothetical protein
MESQGYQGRLSLTNDTALPRILWVEPWAEDYTALPGQTLELYVWGPSPACFDAVYYSEGLQVYIEHEGTRFEVWHDGKRVESGFNRQAGIEAGLQSAG